MRRPKNLLLVRGTDGIEDVFAKLERGPLAIDTETTGLVWHRAKDLVGSINLAAGNTAVFFYKSALGPVARWLSDQVKRERELVFHHAKFDMHHMRESFELHIPYPVHDTKTQSMLLDNRGVGFTRFKDGSHSLKQLAQHYVDPMASEPEKELMKAIHAAGGKDKGDWLLAPPALYAKYSALDPWYTLQLHEMQIEMIRHFPQPPGVPSLMSLYRNESWLTLALRDMEERGIMADRQYLDKWRRKLERELKESHEELVHHAGRDINWNSTPQLRALLFGKRRDGGLALKTERRTEKEEMSTDKKSLIRMNHPVAAALLRYRKLTKQYGTYAVGLLDAQWDDGSIHTSFNQNVHTGRMSAAEPNLQQQDRESGVRRAFKPRKGFVFRFADYSQVELRFAAHFSNEPTLVKGFNTDPDFDAHSASASRMFGTKKPTPQYRDHGKTMNFAMLFGSGEDNVTEGLVEKLSVAEARKSCRDLGYTPGPAESPHRALAQQLLTIFRSTMPRLKQCAREREAVCKQRGFTVDAYGYHRYLSEEDAYKAFNSEIQGSAAHGAKKGLVNVYRELQLGTGELAMLLQVHDEIIYESEGDPRTDRRVIELLNDTKSFRVPIIADMKGSAKSWQREDKEKIKL